MGCCYPVGTPSTSSDNNEGNPALNMFRSFVSSFPPYANPMNYIPSQAFGPYTPYTFSPGAYGQPPPFGPGGMGYAGPFSGQGYGVPNPAYGGVGVPGFPGAPGAPGVPGAPGTVPVLNTRLAGGAAGTDSSVVRTNEDGSNVGVSVHGSPDGQPIFRSKTVQGPNSYGTAFAYSSG